MSYKQCYIQCAVHIMLKCNAVAMIHGEHKLSEAPDFHSNKEYSHTQSQKVSFTKCKLMFNFQPQSNVRMDCKHAWLHTRTHACTHTHHYSTFIVFCLPYLVTIRCYEVILKVTSSYFKSYKECYIFRSSEFKTWF